MKNLELEKIINAIKEAESSGLLNTIDEKILSGYSGEKIIGILQRLSSLFGDNCLDLCYLEIGVFQGLTLLSTASACPELQCYGIDNFSYFDPGNKNLRLVKARIDQMKLKNVSIINQDYEDALENLEKYIGNQKIGLYFIDGPHDYRSQLMCLQLGLRYLHKNAVIVVDDCNYPHVRQANRDFLVTHPEYRLIFEAYTPCHPANMSSQENYKARKGFWNGVNIIIRDPNDQLKIVFPETDRSRKLYENEHIVHSSSMAKFVPQIISSLEIAYKSKNQNETVESLKSLWEQIAQNVESQISSGRRYLRLNTYSDKLPSRKYSFPDRGKINFIDVGSGGYLPTPWKQNKHKILNCLKFEPRSYSSLDTEDTNSCTTSIDVALWKENCEKDFYIYQGFAGSGSSFFLPNHEYVLQNFEALRCRGSANLANTWFERSQLNKIEKVCCYKLDDVLEHLNKPFPYHFLKIDAQGAEYQILQGAERFLKNQCLGLHLELFVLPLYKGIKLLPEVTEYLKKFDFELVKKYPAHGSFDSQHDCLFIKNGKNHLITEVLNEVYQLHSINSVASSNSVVF